MRFAFYGRMSTEDWQDPVTSRARQREQAAALVAGHGMIVVEFFDAGQSRTLGWARRPQAAALVAALADPDRGWDAIVIGEYERAFYGAQYASMAPLFAHYGIVLWTPEAGGPVGTIRMPPVPLVCISAGLPGGRDVGRIPADPGWSRAGADISPGSSGGPDPSGSQGPGTPRRSRLLWSLAGGAQDAAARNVGVLSRHHTE